MASNLTIEQGHSSIGMGDVPMLGDKRMLILSLEDTVNEETTGAVVIGNVEKVPRTTGFFGIISVAFNLLSSWLTVASSMILGLDHGGSVTVLYGLIVVLFLYGAVALSLAEMAARYTTAGGQYHWTALLSPERNKRGLSYCCGSINAIGRVAMIATAHIIVAQLVLAIVADLKVLISLGAVFIISIVCLAVTQPKQPSHEVWYNFTNDTGWQSDGLVFLLGLINPIYGFGGLDGAVHLGEDCFEPAKAVPRAIVNSLVVGFITTFFFAISMLYCVRDLGAAIRSPTG
ncbi:MAG: hypothetical protein Q9176_007553 [Flavoplaca citrina]